jgi:biotin operon repressor
VSGALGLPACVGDTLADVCSTPVCTTCQIWRRNDETREAWLARVRAIYLAETTPPTLRVLSTDRWMTSEEIAAASGVTPEVVRKAISKAKTQGVEIESRLGRIGGYRLKREGSAA